MNRSSPLSTSDPQPIDILGQRGEHLMSHFQPFSLRRNKGLLKKEAMNSSPPFQPVAFRSKKASTGEARGSRPPFPRREQCLLERGESTSSPPLSTPSHSGEKKDLLEEAINSSPPFQPVTFRSKKASTREVRDSHPPPFNRTHSEKRAYLGTLQGHLPKQCPASDPSSSFRPSLLTVGNLASLVQMCPFAQKG